MPLQWFMGLSRQLGFVDLRLMGIHREIDFPSLFPESDWTRQTSLCILLTAIVRVQLEGAEP